MEQHLAPDAVDFLRARDLTTHIIHDLTTLGHVGDLDNKLLAYLVTVSRKLEHPLGMVIQGPSTSGKTDLVEKVITLCPEEDVFSNTRVTAQSLYYMGLHDPFILAHKVVTIEEAAGAEEANYAIRILLSRRRLDLQTIVHQTPTHIVLHGPVAYLETTTEDLTNDETANRVLQIRTDASEAQTQAILEAQRRRASMVVGPGNQAIIARHHAAQRLLQPTAVVIPFAQHIGFPTHHTRARRDHQRLLDLIGAITCLHQYQRQHGQVHGTAFVEAIPADFELAAQLMQGCLGSAFDDLSPKARELYTGVQQMVQETHQVTMTRGDMCRWTGWSLTQVRKHLPPLTELGYLRQLSGTQGQECVYQLTDPPQRGRSWQLGSLTMDQSAPHGAQDPAATSRHEAHERAAAPGTEVTAAKADDQAASTRGMAETPAPSPEMSRTQDQEQPVATPSGASESSAEGGERRRQTGPEQGGAASNGVAGADEGHVPDGPAKGKSTRAPNINSLRRQVVSLIQQSLAQHCEWSAMVQQLNDTGVPTLKGSGLGEGPWDIENLQDFARYMGLRV